MSETVCEFQTCTHHLMVKSILHIHLHIFGAKHPTLFLFQYTLDLFPVTLLCLIALKHPTLNEKSTEITSSDLFIRYTVHTNEPNTRIFNCLSSGTMYFIDNNAPLIECQYFVLKTDYIFVSESDQKVEVKRIHEDRSEGFSG